MALKSEGGPRRRDDGKKIGNRKKREWEGGE
jgi:hypothetical protein